MSKQLTEELVAQFAEEIKNDKQYGAIQHAVVKNGLHDATENQQSIVKMNHVFSHEVKTQKVSNQRKSGRCWMFAALNTFTHQINDVFKLEDFELSQNYTNFWDKFEKANYFYENIMETANEPLDGRLVSWLLDTPQQDGGQWDMLVSLVDKYGVVPKQVMPETFHSSNSRDLNHLLNAKLRKDAIQLRAASGEEQEKKKIAMLRDVYKLLTSALGTPPEQFDFEYRDHDGEFHRVEGLTPKTFQDKYLGRKLHDYVSVINAPTADKPYNQTYTVNHLGNVVGGKPIKYLNVDMETLKNLTIQQLKAKESVWFGCDVGEYSHRDKGIMDPSLYDFEQALGFSAKMSKQERLDYHDGLLTHAMVITGVNLADDKPNRWKVENSWGEKVGNKGYFVMSDEWMSEYTYQVVVHKKYLSNELLKAYEQEPVTLKPWDPMGSLALMK